MCEKKRGKRKRVSGEYKEGTHGELKAIRERERERGR